MADYSDRFLYVGRFRIGYGGTSKKPTLIIECVPKENVESGKELKYKKLTEAPVDVYTTYHEQVFPITCESEPRIVSQEHYCSPYQLSRIAGAYEILSEKEILNEKEEDLKKNLAYELFSGNTLYESNASSLCKKVDAVIDKEELNAKFEMGKSFKKRLELQKKQKEDRIAEVKECILKAITAPFTYALAGVAFVGYKLIFLGVAVKGLVEKLKNGISDIKDSIENRRYRKKAETTEREFLEN